jgi:FKBP-type peptidyl-prolyl cis-trans isomerase
LDQLLIIKKGVLMKKLFFLSVCAMMLIYGDTNAKEAKKEKNTETTEEQTNKKETKEIKRTQTSEGIEYEAIQEGSGEKPTDGQKVSIHYTGWVNDNGVPGIKIDSSRDRNLPVTFDLGRNIMKGWDNVVREMKPGALYRMYIPSKMGYGNRGLPGIVPPNTDLIFDIELLKVS